MGLVPRAALSWALDELRVRPNRIDPIWHSLEAVYDKPWRKYHNMEHVADVLTRIERFERLTGRYPSDSVSLTLAALYHDSIYVVGVSKGESERASACFMMSELGAIDTVTRAADLIRLTVDHDPGNDLAGQLLCDADLLGLTEPQPDLRIFYEVLGFPHTPSFGDQEFVAGRKRWLQGFLADHADRPIFSLPEVRDQYETLVRTNLTEELSRT